MRGGVGGSFVDCLSILTIDHASLSIRTTVCTPYGHLEHLSAQYVCSLYDVIMFLLIASPSSLTVCGRHLGRGVILTLLLFLVRYVVAGFRYGLVCGMQGIFLMVLGWRGTVWSDI